MELLKKLFKSVMILIGIFAMFIVVIIAIMMLGKVSIFGFSFINETDKIDINIATVGPDKMIDNDGTINTIKIKTNRAIAGVEYYDDETSTGITIRLQYTLQGIAKGEVKTVSFAKSEPAEVFNSYTKVIDVMSIEPEGVFFANNCTLTVYLPYNMGLNDIEIETGKAKGVHINENCLKKVDDLKTVKQLNLDHLKINQTGANFSGLNIGKIEYWEKPNTMIKVEKPNLIVNSLEVSTIAGRVNINCPINDNVMLRSEFGTFVFKKLKSRINDTVYANSVGGNVIIEGNIPAVEFGTISNEIVKKAKNGEDFEVNDQFNINGQLLINANATVQVSGYINGAVGLNKNGASLRANILKNYLTATSGCGGINIVGYVDGEIAVGTDTNVDVTVNDIFINNCKSSVIIKANNKPVLINKLSGSNCDIETNRGMITVKSIDNASTVNLTAKDGSIHANFTGNTITGENNIKATGSGNVNVTFKIGQKFKLFAKAKNQSKIKIDLNTFVTFGEEANEPSIDEGGFTYYDEQINDNTNNAISVNLSVIKGTINGKYAE